MKHFLYDVFYMGDQLGFLQLYICSYIQDGIVILIVNDIMASPGGTRRARYTGQPKVFA